MALFRNRPLASAICCFLVVSLIGINLISHAKLLLLLLSFVIALVLTVLAIRKRQCGKAIFCLILCMFGISLACLQSWIFFNVSVGRFSSHAGEEITVEGYVCEVKNSSLYASRYGVQLEEVDGERISAKVFLECEYSSSLQMGDCFRMTGRVRLPENTVLYEEENVLYADGYVGILTCEDYRNCSILDGQKSTFKHFISKIQNSLSFRLRQAVDGESGALASALFLSDKTHLSDDTVLAFRRGGVSHLLALSGLHISIVFCILDIFLKKIFIIPKRYRTVLVLVGVLFYLLFTGCALSTLRAVFMLGFLYTSYYIGEDYDGFTTLCIAAFLIVFFTPFSVLDISFWLSFVATAGIVIFVPVTGEWYKNITKDVEIPKKIRKIIWVSLNTVAVGFFANAAILPLSAYFFQNTSVLSIGLTMILSPLITLALLFSALTLAFPFLTPITFLTEIIFKGILWVVTWCADLPNIVVLLNGLPTLLLLIALTFLLILFAVIDLSDKRWLILPPVLAIAILVVGYADVLPRETGVVTNYICVENEEALVVADGKTAVAVDFSRGSATISRQICVSVTELKCTELQELILTHYHTQSASQISSICGQMKLRNLRLPIPSNDNDAAIAARLEQEAVLHGVQVFYGVDEPVSSEMNIVYYRSMPKEQGGESSVLFAMDIYGHRVSYLNGSIYQGNLSHLAKDAALSADVLIFGAHGTQTLPQIVFFENLENTRRVIFGTKEIYEACPRDLLPREYAVEASGKQFFFKRTAHR